MTDTHGYSDVVFGLFWLLGYQFSPRLADFSERKLWRMDSKVNYGVLNDLAKSRVNLDLITRNWDDLLRVAGSLKLGTANGPYNINNTGPNYYGAATDLYEIVHLMITV